MRWWRPTEPTPERSIASGVEASSAKASWTVASWTVEPDETIGQAVDQGRTAGSVIDMSCRASVVWDDAYLGYDFGEHPMHPVRLDLTIRLARDLGVLDRVTLCRPEPADEATLLTGHTAAYLDALREASVERSFVGHGLGTSDNPVFAGMFDAGALIAGGSQLAAREVWSGRADHGVNIAGGLHHAMRDSASGFCLLNDVVIAIRWLLANGAQKIAYVDVDVHHGDGVQAAFWDDPRVLTISLHQHPATLFPGTGLPSEVGAAGAAEGSAINVALPPGTDDQGWLRAFGAVVPGAVRAFDPDVLISQCGCDTHRDDPLAELSLTVDGQAVALNWMHQLAHESAGGRWVAFGGGGYGVLRCVPRTWTNLIAQAAGAPLDPDTPIPAAWTDGLRQRGITAPLPSTMGEGDVPIRPGAPDGPPPWEPSGESWLDRSIGATRSAVYPLLGLDPDDPRD